MICKKAIFEGRVQGVGFRYCVKQMALSFDVCGQVKNLNDGTVEVQVCGEEEEVEEFLREIVEESSLRRNIENMHADDLEAKDDFKGFIIA